MLTPDDFQRTADYCRATGDITTAVLFEAALAAPTRSLLDVFTPEMRPWLEARLGQHAAEYPETMADLASKPTPFLLGFLATVLAMESLAFAAVSEAEPTASERADARAELPQGQREADAAYNRRVEHLARYKARQRADQARPIPLAPAREQSEHDRHHAEAWKRTLREGARVKREGVDR